MKNRNIFLNKHLKNVCVQGLGYVGSATMAAVSSARDKFGKPIYNVIGLDLKNEEGEKKIFSFNKGNFPFVSADNKMKTFIKKAFLEKRLFATSDVDYFAIADVVLVNVALDISYKRKKSYVDFSRFDDAIRTIASKINSKCLVIVETTVLPGTCEKRVLPIMKDVFIKRKLDDKKIMVAHSYERVMPGPNYIDSIINNYRVYSANNSKSERKCKQFFKSFINTSKYPLTKLSSMTSSETAKIVENSYRAVNIAFIEEWARFAETIGVNSFEIIEAIRKRPTHNNIRQPGFGVGGYCLTKDPYFGILSAKQLFKIKNLKFPFSEMGVHINSKMPQENIKLLKNKIKSFEGKKILLLGASYRPEVDDLRNSPSETFIRKVLKLGAVVDIHDPYVKKWEKFKIKIFNKMPKANKYDAIVLAVAHKFYFNFNFARWVGKNKIIFMDANNILSDKIYNQLIKNGNKVLVTGRGDI